jgi:hypothetical protein
MRPFGLNIWAILVATLLGFLLAMVWYGPLFGDAWLASLGKDLTWAGSQSMKTPMIVSFVGQATTFIAFAWLVKRLNLKGFFPGVGLGLVVALGFIVSAMATDFAWAHWSWHLFTIEAGYRCTYMALAGGILGAWR